MKRLLLLLVAVWTAAMTLAQPVLKFEKKTYDFGTFKENKVQVAKFVFKNVGDKPLVIHQAYGACGCMVANPPKDPIAPGAKATLTVAYNGKGKFAGTFQRPVTVRSNAENSIVRIYIKGNMEVDE